VTKGCYSFDDLILSCRVPDSRPNSLGLPWRCLLNEPAIFDPRPGLYLFPSEAVPITTADCGWNYFRKINPPPPFLIKDAVRTGCVCPMRPEEAQM
jgi:hypothetical protein